MMTVGANVWFGRRATTTAAVARCSRWKQKRTQPQPIELIPRRCLSSSKTTTHHDSNSNENISYLTRRAGFAKEIEALPEYRALQRLKDFLDSKVAGDGRYEWILPPKKTLLPHSNQTSYTDVRNCNNINNNNSSHYYKHEMNANQVRTTLDAALVAFVLHVEARVASLVGAGFYTIGPCGEEALSSAALCLQKSDSLALHYRHVGINLCRQLMITTPPLSPQRPANAPSATDGLVSASSSSSSPSLPLLHQLILDRARGYTVSKFDPVTGGVHCSIGGSSSSSNSNNDFIVTSTLASQCPSAVGRALAYALRLQTTQHATDDDNNDKTHSTTTTTTKSRPISMVTVGDGSVHNHHFWSAFHLARHARHMRVKCPVVFGIADNGLSISYQTKGYVDTLFGGNGGGDPLVPVYTVQNGNDMMEVYSQTLEAVTYARTKSAPVVVHYKNLVRRFGHAATDRQWAYLDDAEIEGMADSTVLESMVVQVVEHVYSSSTTDNDDISAMTYCRIRDRLVEIQNATLAAFSQASAEDKVTRADMLERVVSAAAPSTVSVPTILQMPTVMTRVTKAADPSLSSSRINGGGVKREVMRKHMTRVIAEAMQDDKSVVYLGEDVIHGGYYIVTEGLAQQFPCRVLDFPPDETSLLGAAMGFSQTGLLPIVEIPYAKYLDCGADMFHEIAITHWLSAGKRPVGMVIRLQGFDRGLFGGNFHTSNVLSIPPGVDVCCYSNGEDYVMGFRNLVRQAKAGRVVMSVDCTNLLNLRHLHEKDRGWERSYPEKDDANNVLTFDSIRRYGANGKWAIVTYGNGVVTSLQARRSLVETGDLPSEDDIDIIDCFYLSAIPDGIRAVIGQYEGIVFADICKEGQGGNILSSMACSLRTEGLLPDKWEFVAAPRTYNPLGSTVTFLNTDDIAIAFNKLVAVTSG